MASPSLSYARILFLLWLPLIVIAGYRQPCEPIKADDKDRIRFAENLEFIVAEFFCYGALGKGLDTFDPELAKGGPPPVGARKANLDHVTRRIMEEFYYQEMGHIRAIVTTRGGIPRPQLDISSENFAQLFNKALGYCLDPPFDPYADSIKYILASYAFPYSVASLLGVEAGQDAVIRALLYEKVVPYNITMADFTNMISGLRNELGKCGIKDEGLIVPLELGAENRTTSNILSADTNSLSHARTPPEILRIVYGSGNEHKPGAGSFLRVQMGKLREPTSMKIIIKSF
ncbi:hypothetical protein PTKIN_Ptkin15bG0083500 [Pterospermum kingtungense]